MEKINKILKKMNELGASDLHLVPDSCVWFRVINEMREGEDSFTANELEDSLKKIIQKLKLWKGVNDINSLDFAYEFEGCRYRGNISKSKAGLGATFRAFPKEIPTFEDHHFPPILKDFVMEKSGMVVISGPTGSGKTTTLGAMLDYANEHRKGHIISIEDPIEIVHSAKSCLFTQREVGTHCNSFYDGLMDSLRQDPDIILIGEVRRAREFQVALEAALTGHLVLTTSHASSVVGAIQRLIDQFPGPDRDAAQSAFSECVVGVVCQTLLEGKDGKPIPTFEIMTANNAVRSSIRLGQFMNLKDPIYMGSNQGMTTMERYTEELVRKGLCEKPK